MKGIILAGGSGTRLYPITQAISKQLLPIYNKPMAYYSLSVLMLAGIQEVLIISTPRDIPQFETIFGDGRHLGLKLTYGIQETPRGLADAFIVGERFIGKDSVAMILGDNIFFGHGLPHMLRTAKEQVERDGGGHIFGYYVPDPERFGIIEFDKKGRVVHVEEKPKNPASNYAALGLYFFDNQASTIAKNVTPSARGEIEIPSVINAYAEQGNLQCSLMGRGFAWFDAGTHTSLLEAGDFVATLEQQTGLMIGCVEEIAWRQGYITAKQLEAVAEPLRKSGYGDYLLSLLDESKRRPHGHQSQS